VWTAYQGERVGQGRGAARTTLREKPGLAAKVQAVIAEKVTIAGGTAVAGAAAEQAE
jgi:recombination protein RecA